MQAVGKGDTVTWAAKPPAGITVTPASGTLTVGDAGRADQKVTVSVAVSTKLDYYSVPFELTASGRSVGASGMTINVARRGTIEWYQNNAADLRRRRVRAGQLRRRRLELLRAGARGAGAEGRRAGHVERPHLHLAGP